MVIHYVWNQRRVVVGCVCCQGNGVWHTCRCGEPQGLPVNQGARSPCLTNTWRHCETSQEGLRSISKTLANGSLEKPMYFSLTLAHVSPFLNAAIHQWASHTHVKLTGGPRLKQHLKPSTPGICGTQKCTTPQQITSIKLQINHIHQGYTCMRLDASIHTYRRPLWSFFRLRCSFFSWLYLFSMRTCSQ